MPHLRGQVKHFDLEKLSEAASSAVIEEIFTAPKPGLVDPLGSGCHKDMDWQTFIRSAQAIEPFWKDQAMTGLSGTKPSEALALLRHTGLKMERKMCEATSGINTHKGLIFLLSLLLYGAAYCVYSKTELTAENITRNASSSVKGMVLNELGRLSEKTSTDNLTNGERLYLLHGITGARGEAEKGFPSVIAHGLPELKRLRSFGASANNANIAALLSIMSVCEDSNVIHRGGYEYWHNEYRDTIRETAQKFDPMSDDFLPVEELEKKFLKNRISPGGAADLLCCSIFMDTVTKSTCQQ